MGFWSGLGKVLGIGGAVLGAPFTGGATLGAIPSILGTAGKVAGALGSVAPAASALAQGRTDARFNDALLQQRQDTLGQNRYGNQLEKANTELARNKYTLTAPQEYAKNAVRGDILANARDFSYGAPTMVGNIPVPTSTGGIRPSILSANTRALGSAMSANALAGNATTNQGFAPLPEVPGLTPLPQPNTYDKILTTAGTVGSLAPLFADILAKYKGPQQQPTDPNAPWYDTGVG